ncbi:hypothetical protein GF327_00295 [Candidatus Woesearchaeota archaeon]|nr:hypothetical protein [Candidatus Woesearchaeota archaeon]
MEKEDILKENKTEIKKRDQKKKLEKIFDKEHKKKIKSLKFQKVEISNGFSFGLFFAFGFFLGVMILGSILLLIMMIFFKASFAKLSGLW